MAQCKDYVEKAEQKLVQAKKHMECSKKCMCFIVIIALVILVIIIVVVLASG